MTDYESDVINSYRIHIESVSLIIDSIYANIELLEHDESDKTDIFNRIRTDKAALSLRLKQARADYDTIMSPRLNRSYHLNWRYLNYQRRVRILRQYIEAKNLLDDSHDLQQKSPYILDRVLKAERLLNKLQIALLDIEYSMTAQHVIDSQYSSALSVVEIRAKNVLEKLNDLLVPA